MELSILNLSKWNNLLTSKTSNIFGFWQQTVREAEVMKKKPLLLFRWDRSKDYAAYDDNLDIEDYIEVSSFGYKFKISRLDDWIKALKKSGNLSDYREEK